MSNAPKVSVVVAANVDKATSGLKKVNDAVARLSAPMRKVNRSFTKLKREAGTQKLQKAFKSATRDARRAGAAIGGMAKKIGMLAGAAAIAGIAIVKTFSKSGDLIAKNALVTGWSIKGLQEYSYIAQRQGASQEEVNTSLIAFSKRLGEAKSGSGTLSLFLKKTNNALLEQMKSVGSNEEAFKLYIDAMRNVNDASTQAAMASFAFSRQGVKLSGIAKASAQEIETLRQRAHALGLVMSEEDARAAEQFTDASLNLNYALQGLRNRIGAALAPALSKLSNQLADLAANHGPAIRAWAEQFAINLPQHLQNIKTGFKQLKEALQPLIQSGQWLSDNFGLANTAMIALSVIIGSQLIIGIVALSGAISTLGLALMTTPIGWIIGAIAGLVAVGVLLYKNWDRVTSGIIRFGKMVLLHNPFYIMANSINLLLSALTGLNILDSLKNKLHGLLPDWAVKLLGFNKAASSQLSAQSVTHQAANRTVATQVGGELKIHIDSEGKPFIKQLTSNNANVPIKVNAGLIMAGAS